jgi:hypothetical protein
MEIPKHALNSTNIVRAKWFFATAFLWHQSFEITLKLYLY